MDTRPLQPDANAVAAMKPGQLYLSVIQPISKQLSVADGGETFLIQFDEVTEAQGLLLAAHWLHGEVSSGGFQGFFGSALGVVAPEALRGFELMRMSKAAEVVKSAMAKFGKLYLREKIERQPKLDKLKKPGATRQETDPFFSHDAQFQAGFGPADFATQADAFVREHPNVFFRPAAWRAFAHPDGRAWAVRVGATGFELRIGPTDDPNDPPVIRARESKAPEAEAARLIKEQLAEGFLARG
ncbi:MAG: hypothetical protein H6Q89_2717 [Myxococcaceae bacterium]|nr:hypothetical protein [Myxococcaceae bacterium]